MAGVDNHRCCRQPVADIAAGAASFEVHRFLLSEQSIPRLTGVADNVLSADADPFKLPDQRRQSPLLPPLWALASGRTMVRPCRYRGEAIGENVLGRCAGAMLQVVRMAGYQQRLGKLSIVRWPSHPGGPHRSAKETDVSFERDRRIL